MDPRSRYSARGRRRDPPVRPPGRPRRRPVRPRLPAERALAAPVVAGVALMRLLRFPFSTNVERVALALAYKGVTAEPVEIDPGDRSAVVRLSGQPLVPVLVDGEEVVAESLAILRHL